MPSFSSARSHSRARMPGEAGFCFVSFTQATIYRLFIRDLDFRAAVGYDFSALCGLMVGCAVLSWAAPHSSQGVAGPFEFLVQFITAHPRIPWSFPSRLSQLTLKQPAFTRVVRGRESRPHGEGEQVPSKSAMKET